MFKIIIFLILYMNTFALNLTKQEEEWISQNRNKVFVINTYKPNHIYLYKNKDNEYKGVYVDFFKKLEWETGLKFKFEELDKDEIKDLLTKGDGDIFLNLAKSSAREKYYDYLPTLNTYLTGLFTKDNLDFSKISDYKIGYIEGSSDSLLLKKYYPHIKNLVPIENTGSFGFESLRNNEVDILLGKTSNDVLKEFKFTQLNKIPITSLWMGINKKENTLTNIIERYKKEFNEKEVAISLKKERPLFYSKLLENNETLKNIKQNYKEIRVLLSKSNEVIPLFYKSKNKYHGYLIDRLDELSELTNLPIVFTNDPNNFDIKLIDIATSPYSKELFIPYYEFQLAAFSNNKEVFIDSFSDIKGKKIGISTLMSQTPLIKQDTFNKFYFYSDIKDVLEAILNNDIDYFYGDFKIISMSIANNYLENKIKVAGFFNQNLFLGFFVNNDLNLVELLNILFPNHLSESNILKNELVIPKKLSPNYKYLIILVSIFVTIISILFYSIRKVMLSSRKAERISRALVESFEAANELNDEDTGNHILRVNLYSKFLAEKLGCNNKFIKEISEFASLHDVGKIAVSDSILKKPGKLTEEEFETMKKHVLYGYDLVKKMQLGNIAENIALYHHEKWNGKGYCFGLKEEEIPLEARIVALSDVYDALRQKRIYKDGFTHEEAIEIIKKESGEHFDPKIVEIFLKYNLEFKKIFKSN